MPQSDNHEQRISWGNVEERIDTQQSQVSDHAAPGDIMDLVFMDPNMRPASMNLATPRSFDSLIQGFDQTSSLPPLEHLSQGASVSLEQDFNILSGNDIQRDSAVNFASGLWNTESFWEDDLRPATCAASNAPLSPDNASNPDTPQARRDEDERIAHLFHRKTCLTLSIYEEIDQNPWRTLIWPLARDHPALWHAIAALTCFSMSKQQPDLRASGAKHVQYSTQLLAENADKGEMVLDAALAATLALGFAETWDYEHAPKGISHIRSAGILLAQLLSNRANLGLDSEGEARLEFLYNTWTYMDVLGRFTCNDPFPSYSESTPIPNWSELGWDATKFDPLMGYSTTFFPILRRVADLINKVRGRSTPRNSPAIISKGLELKRSIEEWIPPVDLESIDDPSQNMTDAIQTAEAYRWSTLCLLYQAIPELPNLTSYGELAQKILVYLATIPMNSPTIVVQILPLMVAGCDAVEEEDRDFVRERWHAMSERMVTSVVNRCLRITEEVWKRREDYLWERGISASPNGLQAGHVSNEPTSLSNDIANFINAQTSPARAAATSGSGIVPQNAKRKLQQANGFPISAAFKKGVDQLTRSGCNEYTVRGRLHWLGVMKDWDCQGMFSLIETKEEGY